MAKLAKPIQLGLKVVISLAFFSVLLSFVQGNELADIFTQVDWFYMAVTFGVTIIMVLASCTKWKIILDVKGKKASFYELFKIYLVGYFFSNILPSTVGGDVVRSFYAGRLIENQSYSAVSVFVERFSGIFFLFLLAAVTPLLLPELYQNPYVLFPALGGLSLAAVTLWLWKARNPFYIPNLLAERLFSLLSLSSQKIGISFLQKVADWLEKTYRMVVEKLQKLRGELQVAVSALKTDRTFLIRLVLLTVLFYALTWVNVYTCFKAFGIDVSFVKICAIVPAIMFVAHIPVTLLGNLGFFESVFVLYFGLVEVGGAEALAMALLLRIKMLVMGIVGFFTYLIYKQKNKLEL